MRSTRSDCFAKPHLGSSTSVPSWQCCTFMAQCQKGKRMTRTLPLYHSRAIGTLHACRWVFATHEQLLQPDNYLGFVEGSSGIGMRSLGLWRHPALAVH